MNAARALALLLVALVCAAPASAAAPVTYRADALRTGWYPDESKLSPGTVTGGSFGRVFDARVRGQVYAQPLVSNGTLLVATETNDVYGLDPQTGEQRWTRNLGTPFDAAAALGCGDLVPDVGITSTPVIDPDTGTAYLTAKTDENGTVEYKLHALDLATGGERSGFPVTIAGGAFDARYELQRAGLLLMDGVVYLGFGGHCDAPPFHGWVTGVTTSGRITAMWASSGDDGGAGIWHAGGGLMSDGSGRIFVATGNGSAASPGPGTSPPEGLGESVIRLDTSIAAQDFFSPYDSETLDWWDADFGSGGPVGLPDTFGTAKRPHVLVAVGKNGYVYLLDRDDLGGKGQGDAGGDAASVVRLGPFGGVWSSPAVWPGDGGWVYIPTASGGTSSAGSSGSLDFYRSGRTPDGLPTLSRVGSTEDAFGLGSSPPVVSSNGTASGSALVWILWSPYPGGQGELRAYRPTADGDTPPEPVYSAPVGEATKYNPPGIAGGRVYVGTADGHVLGFGAPTDPGLTGGDVEFDAVTLGDSSRQTATFTATRDLTVTGLSASGPFQAGAASLPAIMSKGDTLDVPVTFTPARTGPAGGALTAQTSAGTFSLGLTGSGRAATALLSASPKVVPFDGVAVGRRSTQSVTLRNDGSQDLSFAGADAPGAPFALSAQPSGTLAPGDSQTLTVTFAPTAPGSFSGTLTVHSSAGDVSIGLSGSAGAPGRLSVSAPGDFGDVTVGEHADRQLVVANTGGTRLTVTKSKPPVSGAFSALDALPEGTTLAPGASRTLTIRFAPSTTGPARDAWQISADDGSTDPVAVALTGTGVIVQLQPVPPPLAPPPALPAPPVPKPLRPSALRVSTDAKRLVIRFRLARAARVDVTVLRGAHAAKTARRSAGAGNNRVLLSRHGLRAGLYRVRIAPAGGAAASASLRIRR